jgi:small acid-soluble spore protein D (minor alpha/beta-type SASP)
MKPSDSTESVEAGRDAALDELKVEVAQELGLDVASEEELQAALDREKYEVAGAIGVPLRPGDNGALSSRDAGRIGGRLGGHLGGQMVKRLVEKAEAALKQEWEN